MQHSNYAMCQIVFPPQNWHTLVLCVQWTERHKTKQPEGRFWLPTTERRQKVYFEDKGPLWALSHVICCGSVGVWLCVRGRCVVVRSVVARCGQSVRLCCRGGHITPASPELCSSSKLKYRSNYEPTEGKCYFIHEIVNIIVLEYLTVKVYLQIPDTCS